MGLNFKGQNRLSLGIINVGFWFLISLLVLTNKDYLNENLRTDNPFLITNIYITYIALQFVFDLVGARLFNKNSFNTVWFFQWLVGTLLQLGIWLCLFYLISFFSFKGGLFLSVFLVLLVLPILQGPFAILINLNHYSNENNDNNQSNLLIINTNEKSFTGDVVYYFFRKINDEELSIIEPGCVYIPTIWDFGGVSSGFAYGDSESMDIYSHLFHRMR